MAVRNKSFHAIIQPIGWQVQIARNALRKFTDQLRGLKERVNIFGG